MNDAQGNALTVGQSVTHRSATPGGQNGLAIPNDPGVVWTATVEHLVPKGTTVPRGGGVTLTSGRSLSVAGNAAMAAQALAQGLTPGQVIPDIGPLPVDYVVLLMQPAQALSRNVTGDHDMTSPCPNFGKSATAAAATPCTCPARIWCPASMVNN